MTLGPFLADYLKRRIDVKPATKEVWQQVVRNLNDHFGGDRELPTITEGDAEDFKMHLVGEGLAPTTVHTFNHDLFNQVCYRHRHVEFSA